ncbi:hypothetical protein CH063_03654, partial [Colletotrichum higginsianum]
NIFPAGQAHCKGAATLNLTSVQSTSIWPTHGRILFAFQTCRQSGLTRTGLDRGHRSNRRKLPINLQSPQPGSSPQVADKSKSLLEMVLFSPDGQ